MGDRKQANPQQRAAWTEEQNKVNAKYSKSNELRKEAEALEEQVIQATAAFGQAIGIMKTKVDKLREAAAAALPVIDEARKAFQDKFNEDPRDLDFYSPLDNKKVTEKAKDGKNTKKS